MIGNEDITHMPEHKRHRRIGRVYQDPSRGTCPSMTILENMSMADNKGKPFNLLPCVNRKKTEEYRSMLAQLGLGLEDKMGVPVGNLSGGQRQAMALLMSTMTPIEFLILDEHTAALDPKTAEIIMQLTGKIVREKQLTTIMVTHNMRGKNLKSKISWRNSMRSALNAETELNPPALTRSKGKGRSRPSFYNAFSVFQAPSNSFFPCQRSG